MNLKHLLLVGSMATMLCFSANDILAQNQGGGGRQRGGGQNGGGQGGGRGNFDPAQFQQRMMERNKEVLEITDDAEWKAIEPFIQKVMDARTALGSGRGGMMGRGGRGGGNQPGGGGFGAPNPELEALQRAIESKASSAELKTALQKYNEARKTKQAALEKAQADLRKLLSPRQEAIATANLNLL